jgi:hypothetical protein
LGAALFFISGAADSFEAEGAADSLDIDEPAAGLEVSPRGDAAAGADSAPFAPWFMPCAVANAVVASKAVAATEIIKPVFIVILLHRCADHHARDNADWERSKGCQVPGRRCHELRCGKTQCVEIVHLELTNFARIAARMLHRFWGVRRSRRAYHALPEKDLLRTPGRWRPIGIRSGTRSSRCAEKIQLSSASGVPVGSGGINSKC